MTEFNVTISGLKRSADEMKNIAKDTRKYTEQVNVIANHLQMGSSVDDEIRNKLKNIANNLSRESQSIEELGNSLIEISDLYYHAESCIIEKENNHSNSNNKKIFKNSVNEEDKSETIDHVSWKSGSIEKEGKFIGLNTGATVIGEVGGASWNNQKFTSGIKWKEDKTNKSQSLSSVTLFTGAISAGAYAAKGSVKGNLGILRGKADSSAGEIKGTGSVNASVIKDGKVAPQLGIKGEASAVGIKGNAEAGLGTENNNVHVGADGKVGSAKISAEAGVGQITITKEDETHSTAYGIKGQIGAEAYLAEGKVSGGLNVLGVKINVGLGGKVGGAGVKLGGSVSTGGVNGKVAIGALVGAELDLDIDWSEFKWGW